jgi:hypothetical protein
MLYIITDGTNYKLGYSQDPEARLKGLQTSNAKPLVLLGTTEGSIEDEKRYHKLLTKDQLVGEWFSANPKLFETLMAWAINKPENLLLQELANASVLAHLLRNNISVNELELLPLKFKNPVDNLPFIFSSLINLADFSSRLTVENEGLIKNLVKQDWLKSEYDYAHPWLIQRSLPISALLALGLNAENLIEFAGRKGRDQKPFNLVISKLFLNCYDNNCNKVNPDYSDLCKAWKAALTTELPYIKATFKFVIDELKASNNIGLLTMYRQIQPEYGLLFDKLASGKSPLVEIPDDYFTNHSSNAPGKKVLWLGE